MHRHALRRAFPAGGSGGAASLLQAFREAPAAIPWHGAGCRCAAHAPSAPRERAFDFSATHLRFGPGVTAELGAEAAARRAARVLVFTDRGIAALGARGPLGRALQSLSAAGLREGAGGGVTVFAEVQVEPTDASFAAAVAAAVAAAPDLIVAVGGGSVMDTAKAANLYLTHRGAELLDFVNAPIGRGLPVPPSPALRPLIALPTTAGTGSETTGVSIFDYTPSKAKTGIASRRLKPTLGLIDPDSTLTMPRGVAVASGFDVLCHALESYTALPFAQREAPARPELRPAYQGSVSAPLSTPTCVREGGSLPRS